MSSSDIRRALHGMHDFQALSGASQEKIEEAEQALNLSFSDEYREYVSAFGAAVANGHELTGVCASLRLNVVDVTLSERLVNPAAPMNWYVVEQANIDGIVIWQARTGEIWQTMPNAQPIKLCDSLVDYIEL